MYRRRYGGFDISPVAEVVGRQLWEKQEKKPENEGGKSNERSVYFWMALRRPEGLP